MKKDKVLNPNYTFSTFVVGDNNKLALAAALAVSESPAEVYNPLYIYGAAGLGKTHLMQSIAHDVLQRNPDAKVLYITSKKLMSEFFDMVLSSRNNPMARAFFQDKYRNVDVLLIDDIQFFNGEYAIQQELFHTFNALYDNHKQVVISSDKPLKEFDEMDDRLRCSFLEGLFVEIQPPNHETHMKIIKKLIDLKRITSIPDVYISNELKTEEYQWLLYSEHGAEAMQFLTEKGLTEETIRKFRLGYSGRFQDSIMIPVVDEKGYTVMFAERKLGGDGPVYRNATETASFDFDKKITVFGLHMAKENEEKELILCEGYMDVILLHQEGFTNAVCTNGSDLTKVQAAILKKYTDRVVISYDSDKCGKKGASKAAELLKEAGLIVKKLDVSPYKDPYDLLRKAGKIEYARRLEEAETV